MNFKTPHFTGRATVSARVGVPDRRLLAAYTITEMLISVSLFGLVIVAILVCHFAGLRFNEFVQPKLQNAQYARQTLGRMIEEVRSATTVQVGTGSVTNFTPAGATNLQAGNALRIFPTTNTSQYVYYVLDSASRLEKIQTPSTNAATIVATAVTNSTVFTLEDYAGNILTNSQNNSVVGILLQMRRDSNWRGISDSVQVRTKVTRRTLL